MEPLVVFGTILLPFLIGLAALQLRRRAGDPAFEFGDALRPLATAPLVIALATMTLHRCDAGQPAKVVLAGAVSMAIAAVVTPPSRLGMLRISMVFAAWFAGLTLAAGWNQLVHAEHPHVVGRPDFFETETGKLSVEGGPVPAVSDRWHTSFTGLYGVDD